MATLEFWWRLWVILVKMIHAFSHEKLLWTYQVVEILWEDRMFIYTHLRQDLTPMWFFSPLLCGLYFSIAHIISRNSSSDVERMAWKFCAVLYVYYDCFSCRSIHFWFKYLMTLIKQHLNFLWDPVSVPLDHIMSNNGWNELQWWGCRWVPGPAAVWDSRRARHPHAARQLVAFCPLSDVSKPCYWRSTFHFCITFRVSTGMLSEACTLLFLVVKNKKNPKKQTTKKKKPNHDTLRRC